VSGRGAPYIPPFGQPRYIGNLLLTRFLLTFEVASFLLLVAAVGAVVLARRRGGIESAEQTAGDAPTLIRPRGTGTMAEGVVTLSHAAAHDRPEEFQPVTQPAEADPAFVGSEPPAGARRDDEPGGGW
jgi:NADH-quinone oxidoreductase subunit J